MRRSDLMKKLRRIAKDCNEEMIVTEGGSHTKVTIGGRTVTVPRHNEINELTAGGILRDARKD